MSNWNDMQSDSLFYTQNLPSSRTRDYVGVHTDRQRRFDARTARRYGDWFVLDVPTPVLWLDTPYFSGFDDVCEVDAPMVIDLWP